MGCTPIDCRKSIVVFLESNGNRIFDGWDVLNEIQRRKDQIVGIFRIEVARLNGKAMHAKDLPLNVYQFDAVFTRFVIELRFHR